VALHTRPERGYFYLRPSSATSTTDPSTSNVVISVFVAVIVMTAAVLCDPQIQGSHAQFSQARRQPVRHLLRL
jgi:hypothetical protein